MKLAPQTSPALLLRLTLGLVGCSIFTIAPAPPALGVESAPPQKLLSELDSDGNGLYDDRERKALMDALQRLAPELDGKFDSDGNGEVTIQEQAEGRHPLTMLIPPQKVEAAEDKIPWGIDVFPEWISSAYLQEDVALGEVPQHVPRGTITSPVAIQDVFSDLPKKVSERGGVEMEAETGAHFEVPGHRDARWNYRWCIFTFRINAATGTDTETVLLDMNKGSTSNKSSPKIWYSKNTGLNIQYVGQNKGGLDHRIMSTTNLVTDGAGWNVLVCGIRYGQMYASVNGVPLTSQFPQPERFSGEWPRDATTYLGDKSGGNMAWAYDALVFGLTEPSEAMVRKMTGWAAHRLGMQERLPLGHPYRTQRPVVDAEDSPHRYVHDEEKGIAWGKGLTKDKTRVNIAGQRVEPQGFERVFYDDFRANRVTPSSSGEGDLWVGPGFNIAVGGDAPLITPGEEPDAYPYDAEKQQQTLSLVKKGDNWRGSAIYTVNDLGHGYTWKGPKIFRIRCMFPKVAQKDLAGGLFPAFWSYDPSSLVWRTGNRIEVDWFELDGQKGGYLNGLSTHVHYPYNKTVFAKNSGSYKRFKVFGADLADKKSPIPGGLYFWDGKFHNWEFVVDEEMTYANMTIYDASGRERWIEIYRCPTAPTYLEPLDIQINYALKARHGSPKKERQDFVVDMVEVLQKTEQLEEVPAPFTALPQLTGSTEEGGTVTCEPNLPGTSDIRYYWFADGYPLTYSTKNTYTVTAAETGKELRCMVKAVGALDMPEAWSNKLK